MAAIPPVGGVPPPPPPPAPGGAPPVPGGALMEYTTYQEKYAGQPAVFANYAIPYGPHNVASTMTPDDLQMQVQRSGGSTTVLLVAV